MANLRFDIFRGVFPDTDVEWMESVEGLAAAYEQMKFLAAANPGPYFVFSISSHKILAATDTTRVLTRRTA